MTTYKNFMNAARVHFNSSPFLRGLVSGHLAIFIFGVVTYLLGAFLINLQSQSAISCYESLTAVGIVFALIGLVLSLLADDAIGTLIVSSLISAGALAAWIVILSKSYMQFMFGPLFNFLLFAAIAIIVGVKSEKFMQMRAASAARSRMAGMPCQRCGALIPMNAAFCPSCGSQKPAVQQYAMPVQPQYAPPQPQYAPPQPQYAPPQPQYAAPAPAAEPEAPASVVCTNCGADLPAGAAFCSKCGAKQ